MGLSFVGIIFIIVGTVGAVFLHCLRRFLNKRSLKAVCEALELPDPGKYSPLKCDALLDRNPWPSSCKYSPQKFDAFLDLNASPSSCLDSYTPTKPNTVFRHEHDYGYLPHSLLPLLPINTSPILLESAFCCAPPPLWLSSSCAPPPHSSQQEESFSSSCAPPPLWLSTSRNLCGPPHPHSSLQDLAESSIGPIDILPCPLESDLFNSALFYRSVRGTKFSSVMESDRLKSATLKLSMELFNEHLKAMSSVPSSTENDLADSSGPTDILSSEQLKEMSSLPSLDLPFTHRYRSDLSSEELKEMGSLPSPDLPFTGRYRSDLFSPIGPPPMENWNVDHFPSTSSYSIAALLPIGSAVMTGSDSAHVVGMAKPTDGLLEFQDQFP